MHGHVCMGPRQGNTRFNLDCYIQRLHWMREGIYSEGSMKVVKLIVKEKKNASKKQTGWWSDEGKSTVYEGEESRSYIIIHTYIYYRRLLDLQYIGTKELI